MWGVTPLCLFWIIWNERNRRSFENKELSVLRLKNSFFCNLFSWTKLYIAIDPMSLCDFIDSLGSH